MSAIALSDGRLKLQTDEISIDVLPAEGGRIASLQSRKSGLEFLIQSHRSSNVLLQPGLDTQFRNGPCAGIEECLPTIAPCGSATVGGPAPDHGDFWQLAWHVLSKDDRSLTIEAQGFSRPLTFRKTISVERNELSVAYKICNVGNAAQSFLYACHPLFAVDAGDRIVLPDGIDTLRLDYSRRNRLGIKGDAVAWPETQEGIALDTALPVTEATADMFYTSRLSNGACSIHRKATDESCSILFSTEKLPYLGVWLCYGGWPDDAVENLQYAVALEPAIAPFNALDEAQRENAAKILEPKETFAFKIVFRIH